MRDPYQLVPSVAFLHLAVDQAWFHLPLSYSPPATPSCEPLAKMSGQGIKGEIQAITREERETARGQDVSQGMDDAMSGVLRTGAQMKDGKQLRRGVDDQPQPQDAGMAAEPGSQFIQL